ncbi:uncharacterized protein Triagg1_3497 [Trichoderma aggressivum f. europaeum]|uniref:Stc1 domain-containing protein n=1 Tax=Trichoderma aggressivum f. europaeum TaxID=173218 RepID=A0AAE1IFB2_9HYPO|nr:hypothetical protein Triagg1_3497 [Trichoderma aggressivum f. europaeum]
MANRKENANFNLATRAGNPTRFRCKVGGEWKPLDEFSKNQQRLVSNSTGGYRINAANSGMTCREHSAGQRTEMTCELCGLVKPLSAFSGNTKRNGSIAPVTGYSSLGLEDGEVASIIEGSAPSEYSASETSSSRALPPHLRGSIGQDRSSLASSTDGRNASNKSSFAQHLPPHLRPLVQQGLSLDASSDYAGNSEYGENPSSISTATTAREARFEKKARRVSFNAWDPSGIQHRGFKSESSAMGTSAMGTSEADEEEDGAPNPQGQARGKWPKIVRMSQTELRQVGTNHHVAARDPGPVHHRPVQYDTTKCCEPDEEDGEDY